jgi:hypothetical protein
VEVELVALATSSITSGNLVGVGLWLSFFLVENLVDGLLPSYPAAY